MTSGLDTSVVVRLLVGEPAAQGAAARQFLDDATAAAGLRVSDLVLAETWFALRHHYAVPEDDALRAIGGLLADPRILASPAARRVFTPSATRVKPGLIDRLIHAAYADDGASVVTFDRAAARLPGARLLG